MMCSALRLSGENRQFHAMDAETADVFRHALLRDVEPPRCGGEKVKLCEAAGIARAVRAG